MKKIRCLLLSAVAVAATVGLASCENGGDSTTIEATIEAAEKMSETELAAKAVEEIGSGKLIVRSQTSGCAKVLAAFKTKYGIDYDETAAAGSYKDYQLYTALDVVSSGQYYSDMVMIQDIRSLKQYMNDKILYSYQPGDIEGIATEDQNPMAGIYFNKLFMYNLSEKNNINFTNVWQLAGSSSDTGHIGHLSFQSPSTENINMNFLLSMTSPSGISKLTTAYKDYYGADYVESDDYANIGFKFISEYITNVTTFHSSDTTAVKATLPADTDNTVFYCAFAKYKDLIKAIKTAGSLTDEEAATEAAKVLGWEDQIDGFKGFLYKMYPMIPATVKYPYATCLYVRYLMTSEGFTAGWGGEYGYYSANPANDIKEGDKTIDYWKANCLVEDGDYLPTVKNSVVSFVNACIASHS